MAVQDHRRRLLLAASGRTFRIEPFRLAFRQSRHAAESFQLFALALVVIQFLWGVINWITNYLLVKIGLQALLKLRTDLYAYLQSLSLKYHDVRRSSDSSFRVAYDSQSIQTIYNKGFTGIFGSVITLIGTFAVMVRLDWQLTLLSLAIVPFIIAAIYFFAHRIRRESTFIQEHESAVLMQAQEGLELDSDGARLWPRRIRSSCNFISALNKVCRQIFD